MFERGDLVVKTFGRITEAALTGALDRLCEALGHRPANSPASSGA